MIATLVLWRSGEDWFGITWWGLAVLILILWRPKRAKS